MAVVSTKIAAVSYLNTVPFIYGITHAGALRADLLLSPPAGCARAFLDKKADIALVPTGSLGMFDDAEIVTDFCIGAEKSVRTVVVMSNTPIRETKALWLDSHSMTSALLTRILAAELWNITPQWNELTDYSAADRPEDGDAFLFIGDKVFDYEGRFKYTYDLADCWRELTGKPFVFAVWIARKGTDPAVIEALELSLTLGVERIWEAIVEYGHDGKDYAYSYLTENIDFLFDNQKHRALELFWEKGLKAVPRANPG
jgi:chorismate dehydratase